MSEAAPAAAPASTGGGASAPSAPAASPAAAKPPRGYAPAPKPAGNAAASAPAAAREPTAAATPPAAQAKATGTAPAQQTEAPKREPRMTKVKIGDDEHEVDISEHIERELASYKRKVKVDGQEREVSLKDMEERYPLAASAYERFEAAAAAKKEVEAREGTIKKLGEALRDPAQAGKIMRQLLGDQFRTLLESELHAEIQRERMTPEQREQAAREQERETGYEKREREMAEREAMVKAHETRAMNAEKERLIATYQRDFPIQLRAAGVEPTPDTMARMAQLKREAHRLKMPVTDAQIAEKIAGEVKGYLSGYAQSLDPAKLRELIGEEASKKIVAARVADYEGQPGRPQAPRVRAERKGPPESVRTPDQMRAYNRQQDLEAQRRWSKGRG